MTKTDDVSLIVLLTFFIGVVRMMGGLMMILHFIPILMPKGQRFQLYCVYYPLTLLIGPISGYAMAWLSDRFNWHFSFHFCNFLLFLALIIIIITVHDKKKGKVLGMWKFDWFSHILIAGWTLSLVYVLVYGRTKDWFDSIEIRIASILTVVQVLILLLRNALSTKPLLKFYIFKTRNIRVGLILIFFFGAFFTMTNSLNTWMNIAFHGNQVENAYVNLAPVLGYFAGSVFCYFYYRYFNNFKVAIIFTVVCYTVSFVFLYFLIDMNVEPYKLFFPMCLRGFAIIVSYITIGLYVTSGVPSEYLSTIPFFLIFFRSFLGPVFWGNIYSNWLYIKQIKLMDKLATWSNSDAVDPIFRMRYPGNGVSGASSAAYKVYSQQAVIGSIKELFGWVILLGCGLIIFLVFFPIYKKVDRKIFNWKKSKNTKDVASTIAA